MMKIILVKLTGYELYLLKNPDCPYNDDTTGVLVNTAFQLSLWKMFYVTLLSQVKSAL